MSYTYKHHTTAIQNIQVPAIKIATVRIQNRTLHLILRNMFLYISWPNNINSLPTTEKKICLGNKEWHSIPENNHILFWGETFGTISNVGFHFWWHKRPLQKALAMFTYIENAFENISWNAYLILHIYIEKNKKNIVTKYFQLTLQDMQT